MTGAAAFPSVERGRSSRVGSGGRARRCVDEDWIGRHTETRKAADRETRRATTGIREREARIERVSRDGDDALPRTVRARARDE